MGTLMELSSMFFIVHFFLSLIGAQRSVVDLFTQKNSYCRDWSSLSGCPKNFHSELQQRQTGCFGTLMIINSQSHLRPPQFHPS